MTPEETIEILSNVIQYSYWALIIMGVIFAVLLATSGDKKNEQDNKIRKR